MKDFTKDVCVGVKETYGGRRYSVWCHIKYLDGKLSITGVEGATHGGNCLGSCGQIYDELKDFVRLEPEWTSEMLVWFISVWKKWHLNDMQAGCEHQRKSGSQDKCDICDYEYGSAWLTMEVPETVLDALKNLPESKKSYCWI